MISVDERQSIIDEAVEQMLKLMPEVVGNLMVANTMYSRMTSEFLDKNPTFKNHREIVQEVVAGIEGNDPTLEYSKVLKLAEPKIAQAIKLKTGLNMSQIDRKSFKLDFDNSDNGEI